ncbi:hypothetical protein DUNSADRAFT_4534 [Dunaliella salina]|uniref:Uncharacterized protein n=1 Tax=Dunaliella salina TaxID=3046 RepID=A0ABQ7GRU0_DUNSA|nr:hypothetical protein DUNSADRAFT_4534 [Dunaliella salina]|eukprot:KAF5837326.1 hypothetical protein DUNSADRAFT_4534 [Dunaliella salina]
MVTRMRSSMRVRPLQTLSHQGHAMDGQHDPPPQQQTRQLYHPTTPDSYLPSESSAASDAQDLPASSPPSPSSYSHLQLEQQQRPRSATRRLSNLGIQAAFKSCSLPDPKLPALDEDCLLPQSPSTLLQESSQIATLQDSERASHNKLPEPMEQGVPLSWLHSACADGQYRDAHVLGNKVVQSMGHELRRALEDSDGDDTPDAGGASQGGDHPGSRYAAMQRRIAELHQDKKSVHEGPEGPSGTATAGTTGTAPAGTEQVPPLVSWAAAWRPGLQAHYSAAMERAKQRLERQAAVSRATLGLGSSFTAPNTPPGQGCQPSTPCPAGPFGSHGLKHGRGAGVVSFAGKESMSRRQCPGGSAHDTAEDSSLTSPSNSSMASTAGAERLEGSQGAEPTPQHHHHQGPGVDSNPHHHHHHHQQQQGRLHHRESSKSSVGGQSMGGMGQRHSTYVAPAAAVPDAVLQQSQEAAAINAALQLLDAYSQLSLEMYGQDGGAAAIAKVRSAIEVEAMDLPDPLHPEGSSAFLSARKQLRRPVPPPEFPSGAAWSYLAAAGSRSQDGLAAIEGSVRDMHKKMKVMVEQRGQAHGLTATPALLAIEQSLDVQALSTVRALRHQAHAGLQSLSSWNPVGLSSHPPLATLPESTTIAQAALRRLHLADQSSDRHSSNAGSPEALCHGTPSHGFWGSLPASPPSVKQCQGDGARPPSHAPRGVCGPTGVYTVSSTAPPVPDPEKQGPVLEGLWWWLEDLMVEMHGCESMRLRELEVEKASASTPQVVRREVHSPRPNTRRRSRPGSPLRGLASMLQFDATKPTWQAKAHASKMAELAAAANAMRAAGSKFTDPECLPRILYFMIHLTSSIEQGRVPWKDAGFLLCAGLELILGEMEWLASHVHLAQGPNSPHLRVLHAVLTAYECQVDYSTRLGQYAADVRAQLEKAQERARVAEDALQAAEGRAQADHSLAASLHMQCRELQGDNKELKAHIAALEERLALQADADQLPS